MSDTASIQPARVNTRRWQRYKLSVPIRVILNRASKVTIIDGRGNELSEGGMALTAGVELEPGHQIAVEFTPPYSMPIRVKGTVRNRFGYRYGIEFVRDGVEEAEVVARLRLMLTALTQ